MDRLLEIIREINLPFAYHHFSESEYVDPPFLIYLIPNANNFSADGIAYFKKNNVLLELYTDKKDISLENRVESILEKQEIFYTKYETYIESEGFYSVTFNFEMEG